MKLEFKPYTDEIKLVPGMIVKKNDNELELVGHINDKEGYCDCCSYGEIIEYSDTFLNQISKSIALCYIEMDSIPQVIAEFFLQKGIPVTHDTFEDNQYLLKNNDLFFKDENSKLQRLTEFKNIYHKDFYNTDWKVFKKSTNQGTKESPTAGKNE